jgi:WD40 repeat protein
MATGCNDNSIRVYGFFDEPKEQTELFCYTGFITSIKFANYSAKFLSGTEDGSAIIWYRDNLLWKNIQLLKPDFNNMVIGVAWSCDDTFVITARESTINICNSQNGDLLFEVCHSVPVSAVDAHPRDPRLILTACHDGYILLININNGKIIKKILGEVRLIFIFYLYKILSYFKSLFF